jgi:phage gp46-like protein
LKFIPKEKITDKIIRIALEYDGRALQFIPEEKKTDEIIIMAIKNNGFAFVRN